MKFIAKSILILSLTALALGTVTYNVMSSNVKQSGTINLVRQNVTSETRAITAEVTQVDMDGPFDLVIMHDDRPGLTVQGEERLLSRVVVQQEGAVLHISTKGMLVTMNQTLKVTLNLPTLSALNQSGSGDSEVRGFTGPKMSVNMSGSGDLVYSGQYQHIDIQNHGSGNMDLDVRSADRIDLLSSGSGNVDVVGKVNLSNIVLTGSGNIDAQRMISSHTDAVAQGSGNLQVYAGKEVNVTATGSGDVDVYGNPARKTINKTGSGDVNMN